MTTTLLCDAATVREGLLHVLGGGISAMGRTDFPSTMQASLAVIVHLHPTELEAPHVLRVLVQNADGQDVAHLDVTIDATQLKSEFPTRDIVQPIVIPLQNVTLPGPGDYSVEVLIDGIHQESVPFAVSSVQIPGATPGLGS